MEPPDRSLMRGIGRWDLVGILINGTVGAGIFAVPAKAFGLIGTYSIFGWIACAALVALFAICFAEVSSRFDGTGGPYLYVIRAFGPQAGYLIGWIGWVSRLLAYASVCNLAVNYAGIFYTPLSSNVPHLVAISAIAVALTAIVLLGVRLSAMINNGFTVIKLIVLFGLAAAGLVHIALSPTDISRLALPPIPAVGQFQSAVMLMLFAFIGFEAATINGGEMREPRRDAPFALIAGLIAVTGLYVLIQLVCIGTVPDLIASNRPLADSAVQILGPIGGRIVTLGAVITMIGTLMVLLIVGPRMLFAMAEHGQLPAIFSAIHPRFRTPHLAILMHSVLAWVLTANSSVIGALSVATLTRLVTYAATCAAMIALRRHGDAMAKAHFRVPGGTGIAIAAVATSLWLIMASTSTEVLSFAAILLIGIALGGGYAILRRR
jgi:APA family basic amino acid/polyamine antiporter